jgi:hypothetical protein
MKPADPCLVHERFAGIVNRVRAAEIVPFPPLPRLSGRRTVERDVAAAELGTRSPPGGASMAAPPDPIIARRRDIYASIHGLAGVIAFLADRLHHQELGELARATMDAATVSLEGADADHVLAELDRPHVRSAGISTIMECERLMTMARGRTVQVFTEPPLNA